MFRVITEPLLYIFECRRLFTFGFFAYFFFLKIQITFFIQQVIPLNNFSHIGNINPVFIIFRHNFFKIGNDVFGSLFVI